MSIRWSAALLCLLAVAAIAFVGGAREEKKDAAKNWTEVAPGILRSPALPAGYALIDEATALLIDAPLPADGLKAHGINKIDAVLLTHHHRDTCAATSKY